MRFNPKTASVLKNFLSAVSFCVSLSLKANNIINCILSRQEFCIIWTPLTGETYAKHLLIKIINYLFLLCTDKSVTSKRTTRSPQTKDC